MPFDSEGLAKAMYNPLSLPRLPSVKPRDPDSFYYAEKPLEPTRSYELTCGRFRHAGVPEVFDVVLAPGGATRDIDGQRALLEVVAEASNLSDPVLLPVPLQLTASERSTMAEASEAVAMLCKAASG